MTSIGGVVVKRTENFTFSGKILNALLPFNALFFYQLRRPEKISYVEVKTDNGWYEKIQEECNFPTGSRVKVIYPSTYSRKGCYCTA